MKVGIITFHRVNNYGAVLQAYALQKTIESLGCQCHIIDYERKNLRDICLWQKNKIICFLKGKPDKQGYTNIEFIKMVLDTMFFNKREVSEKFTAFRKRYSLSPAVNSDTIKSLNSRYDLFIAGSDQVFNCGRVYLDKNYFLDFVDKKEKKGSYAASFGIREIPPKYVREYQRMLSDFSYLSVREELGVKLIRDLINKETKVVLDPTLLFSREKWLALLEEAGQEMAGVVKEKEGKTEKKAIENTVGTIGDGAEYKEVIVVYMLEYSKNLLMFAKALSKKTNCSIRLLNKPCGHKLKEDCREDVGPIEWLMEIQNAKYVVTNSFHGVAFSINFNKDFYAEITGDRIRGAMGSRIENILKIFELEERLISSDFKGFTKEYQGLKNPKESISYDRVNDKLRELREDSLSFLLDMLYKGEKREEKQ